MCWKSDDGAFSHKHSKERGFLGTLWGGKISVNPSCSCIGTGQLSLHGKNCISLQRIWLSPILQSVTPSNSTLKQPHPSMTTHTLTAHLPMTPSGCSVEAAPPQLCSPFLLAVQGQLSASMQRWFLACWEPCSSHSCTALGKVTSCRLLSALNGVLCLCRRSVCLFAIVTARFIFWKLFVEKIGGMRNKRLLHPRLLSDYLKIIGN